MSSLSTTARRKFWGWGLEQEGLDRGELEELAETFAARFGLVDVRIQEPPRVEDLDLPKPRLSPPSSLAGLFTDDRYERAAHSYGRSFRDLVRAIRRDYSHPPDLVAFPRDEREIVSILEWCTEARVAAIPFGGGSSVVGGVEPDVGDGYLGTVSIDLRQLDRVLEIDPVSRSARIQAGVLGPALEAQLKPHGLTLRHFPQSFEWSSLGGWIATRSGGHFATLYTHIDEFVQGLRVVTPRGVLETRRLPGSGAGPSPDRLVCGSEGTLGVITEAWMRLQQYLTEPVEGKATNRRASRSRRSSSSGRLTAAFGRNAPLFVRPGKGAPLSLDGRLYRGRLEVAKTGEFLRVVNHLPLQRYLEGVVAGEMPHTGRWRRSRRRRSRPGRTRSRRFRRGSRSTSTRTRGARSTWASRERSRGRPRRSGRRRGEIVTYGGKVATTYYFSTSGGKTASAADVFGFAVPYLVSRPDPCDSASPYHSWGPIVLGARTVQSKLGVDARVLDATGVPPRPDGCARFAADGERARRRCRRRSCGPRSACARRGRRSASSASTGRGAAVVFGSTLQLAGVARGVTAPVLARLGRRLGLGEVGPFARDASGLVDARREADTDDALPDRGRRRGSPAMFVGVAPLVRLTQAAELDVLTGTVRPRLPGAAVTIERRRGRRGSAWRRRPSPRTAPSVPRSRSSRAPIARAWPPTGTPRGRSDDHGDAVRRLAAAARLCGAPRGARCPASRTRPSRGRPRPERRREARWRRRRAPHGLAPGEPRADSRARGRPPGEVSPRRDPRRPLRRAAALPSARAHADRPARLAPVVPRRRAASTSRGSRFPLSSPIPVAVIDSGVDAAIPSSRAASSGRRASSAARRGWTRSATAPSCAA